MDATDIRILELLKKNARLNASCIGEKINMSVSAVIERIRKLELSGIIRQYTVLLDSKKIGKDMTVFLSVRLDHPRHNTAFIEKIALMNDVIECHNVTGDFDFILKIVLASTHDLDRIIIEIKNFQEVDLTRTQLVLSTYKLETTVLPDPKSI